MMHQILLRRAEKKGNAETQENKNSHIIQFKKKKKILGETITFTLI